MSMLCVECEFCWACEGRGVRCDVVSIDEGAQYSWV